MLSSKRGDPMNPQKSAGRTLKAAADPSAQQPAAWSPSGCAAAVVLLVFGLVNLLHTKRDFSENENRKLQAYPALTAASSSGRKLYVEAAVCLCRSVLCARPLDFRQAADRPAA